MIQLLNAIQAAFLGNTGLTTAFPGGMHRDIAPEGTAFPYVVTNVIASPTRTMYGQAKRTDASIRFSAVGEGHNATGLVMDTLTAFYDDLILTLSSQQNYSTLRMGDPLPLREPNLSAAGKEVWRWTCEYQYSVR
jgi:hypothetical protein